MRSKCEVRVSDCLDVLESDWCRFADLEAQNMELGGRGIVFETKIWTKAQTQTAAQIGHDGAYKPLSKYIRQSLALVKLSGSRPYACCSS